MWPLRLGGELWFDARPPPPQWQTEPREGWDQDGAAAHLEARWGTQVRTALGEGVDEAWDVLAQSAADWLSDRQGGRARGPPLPARPTPKHVAAPAGLEGAAQTRQMALALLALRRAQNLLRQWPPGLGPIPWSALCCKRALLRMVGIPDLLAELGGSAQREAWVRALPRLQDQSRGLVCERRHDRRQAWFHWVSEDWRRGGRRI